MKKRLIVNADDFGLTPGVNYGIIESFSSGVLTSTTLMVNQPYADHAVELSKKYPELGIGIHLTFDKGVALSGPSSLTDANGNFKKYKELLVEGEKEDFKKEIEAQLKRFNELLGRMPTHMDSHHHVHIKVEEAFKATCEIGEKYNLKYRKNDELIGEFYDKNVELDHFYKLVNGKGTDLIELMCHPAYIDKPLLATSSYNYKREDELEILINEDVKNFIKDNYILMTYEEKVKSL